MTGLKYVYPDFLDNEKIKGLGSNGSNHYIVNNNILYRTYTNVTGTGVKPVELVRALPNPTQQATIINPVSQTTGYQTVSIQTGAFKNCTKLTTFNANAQLKTIETGAFDGSGVVNFDFTAATSAVQIGQNALGACREKMLDNSGYIYYQKRQGFTVTVPASLLADYQKLPAFFMYDKYGCITAASGGSSASNNSAASAKLSVLKLKEEAFDTTVGGINYHVMTGSGKYNGVEYASAKTDFIAVVTSLGVETEKAKTVVIPESMVVGGVTYTVVGIDNDAFGSNSVVEKLVLPSSDIIYSSQAFAHCSALGYIQFNDVAPYDATDENSVASLPVGSAQSLTENSRKEDED